MITIRKWFARPHHCLNATHLCFSNKKIWYGPLFIHHCRRLCRNKNVKCGRFGLFVCVSVECWDFVCEKDRQMHRNGNRIISKNFTLIRWPNLPQDIYHVFNKYSAFDIPKSHSSALWYCEWDVYSYIRKCQLGHIQMMNKQIHYLIWQLCMIMLCIRSSIYLFYI